MAVRRRVAVEKHMIIWIEATGIKGGEVVEWECQRICSSGGGGGVVLSARLAEAVRRDLVLDRKDASLGSGREQRSFEVPSGGCHGG